MKKSKILSVLLSVIVISIATVIKASEESSGSDSQNSTSGNPTDIIIYGCQPHPDCHVNEDSPKVEMEQSLYKYLLEFLGLTEPEKTSEKE